MEMKVNKQEYLGYFSETKRMEALKVAHEIRRFEIDLYWKRASYFWTFIAVAFAGFFASTSQPDLSNSYVIACLGLIFSLAWYLVNRGSSAWQRNWEVHVDLLEDDTTGPLHKAIVSRGNFRFFDLFGPFHYSPSRINTMLAFLLVVVWAVLAARILRRAYNAGDGLLTIGLFTGIATVTCIVMFSLGRTRAPTDVGVIDINLRNYL